MSILKIVTRSISSKQGNKNYYKGNRSGRIGSWSLKGHFLIDNSKVRNFVVPNTLQESPLTFSMSPKYTTLKKTHSVIDYFGDNWTGDDVVAETCKQKAMEVFGNQQIKGGKAKRKMFK
jgi:hypothetical protein